MASWYSDERFPVVLADVPPSPAPDSGRDAEPSPSVKGGTSASAPDAGTFSARSTDCRCRPHAVWPWCDAHAVGVVDSRDTWPIHRPFAPDAPIPGLHWYSCCDDSLSRVSPGGVCDGCGERACPKCGRETIYGPLCHFCDDDAVQL